jgi:hypothetical protein
VRADSAFYSKAFIGACRAADARFSVTVRMNTSIREAIDGIDEAAWTPIPYWLDGGADVAETTYTAFKSSKRDAVDVRLIVRRVRPTPGSQLALDVVFDHHALVTDRDGDTLELQADHRAHARVELVIRDLKDGALAHLPSGKFTANAAWLTLAVLAHNLGRQTLTAAGVDWSTATVGSLRRRLIAMPARLVSSARRLRLRAPHQLAVGRRAHQRPVHHPRDPRARLTLSPPSPVRHDPIPAARKPAPAAKRCAQTAPNGPKAQTQEGDRTRAQKHRLNPGRPRCSVHSGLVGWVVHRSNARKDAAPWIGR